MGNRFFRTDPKVRFASKFQKRGKDECWPWTAATANNGYGYFWNGWRNEHAHRFAYRQAHGVEDGDLDLHVCHTCDNPPCVNPAHLFVGTHRDNMRDMIRKGRGEHLKAVRGERGSSAKLTPEQAEWAIRAPLSGREVARRLGVHPSTIHSIRKQASSAPG